MTAASEGKHMTIDRANRWYWVVVVEIDVLLSKCFIRPWKLIEIGCIDAAQSDLRSMVVLALMDHRYQWTSFDFSITQIMFIGVSDLGDQRRDPYTVRLARNGILMYVNVEICVYVYITHVYI